MSRFMIIKKPPEFFFPTFEPVHNAPSSKIKTTLLPVSVSGAYDALNGKACRGPVSQTR